MIANFTPQNALTVSEVFYAQKAMELVYFKTIDTYRARLHTPLSILRELNQVLKDFINNKIKSFDITVEPVRLEALETLKLESELIFDQVDKKHFLTMPEKAKKDDYRSLHFAIQIVLSENKNYGKKLFDIVATQIQQINEMPAPILPAAFIQLTRLINHQFSHLLTLGYSKNYPYKLIYKIFKQGSQHTFVQAYTFLSSLTTRETEDYTVVFCLWSSKSVEIDVQTRFKLSEAQINDFSQINAASRTFFEGTKRVSSQGKGLYLGVPCKGIDYVSVIREAKKVHGSVVDLLHLGFPLAKIDTFRNALVVGSVERAKTSERTSEYFLDGHFKNNQDLYDKFASKMIAVIISERVSSETKNKIISAIRYLRLGWEASELEQKFVNFWIGLEYIFSNYDVGENTIKRMKSFFVSAHSLIYIKRNMHEFHSDINRLRISNLIQGYNDDMSYLKLPATYDSIIATFSESNPLLAFRAYKYKEWVTDVKIRTARIDRHEKNLERHLMRLYRIRNEIVHDAAIHANIEVLTGNLRYYLSFVLNSLLEYFNNAAEDINQDGVITIDDFFIHQEIKLESVRHRSFSIDDLFNVKSVTEIFS
jgi:hypothetical protein